MNNWGNRQHRGGRGNQGGHQNMGGQGGKPSQPLLPPPFMMLPDMGMNINPAPEPESLQPLIGPVQPDNIATVDMAMSDDEKAPEPQTGNKDEGKKDENKNNARDRENRKESRDKDRGRGDQRSRERDRGSRHDRNDRGDRFNDRNRDRFSDRNRDRSGRSRDRDRRDRQSKWGDSDMPNPNMPGLAGMPGIGGNVNPGMMMPGMGGMPGQGMNAGIPAMGGMGMPQGMGQMGQMGMGGQGMVPGGQGMVAMGQGAQGMGAMGPDDGMGRMGAGIGANGQPMGGMGQGMMQFGMQNMPNANMQNMQMMPGMNNMMMNNPMDPVMMRQQQMMMRNQPIYITDGVLLPPVPGTTMPNRREKPQGCRTIFVGGLPPNVTEATIAEIFQPFGDISDIKLHRQGVGHVRFEKHDSVEASFFISGYRFKTAEQTNNEATTLFVDYALNRDDQNEFEKNKRARQKTPPRLEPFNPATLTTIGEKIKSDDEFLQAAPTLVAWLERGFCDKRNANQFYSLIQASNNQVRRLFNEKMALDDEFHTMKSSLREKFLKVVDQFEQVAKILAVAKHQRVSDHFSKQQRRNIEMWLKMTEELENIKEEFNAMFEDEEIEKCGRNVVPSEKYEQLRAECENLQFELEGYKNEAHLAKDEAERKFEKFKAHWIAQQALQNKPQVFPPLPQTSYSNMAAVPPMQPPTPKPQPPPPTPDDDKVQTSGPAVPPSEAKLISILTAFLMVHPLGASLDYLVSYVRSMVPNVTQATVHQTLQKYGDVFTRKTSGIGANIEHRWGFMTFDLIKHEAN
ncbi:hypothetical protein O0L34_g10363 [Tuta absoluta]|nr:hypothetical protein O0L34_g10363 [Tuta absoluta]